MTPAPGERLLRFVGDHLRFQLRAEAKPDGTRAVLRTNSWDAPPPCAKEIPLPPIPVGLHTRANPGATCPCKNNGDHWEIELPLIEPGFFEAKAYLYSTRKAQRQHWPDGSDVGISVHPNFTRTANTIYCAFTRLFWSDQKTSQQRR